MVVRVIQIARLLITLASRHRSLVFENLALRQQLAVYHRTRPKPTVRWSDRLFWVGLRRAWPDWKSALVFVRPATVIAWHRRGFAWYWTRRSRPRGGRPQVGADVRRLTLAIARVVLAHDRRRILHVNVTPHPTSAWTRQQLREAVPHDANAWFLLHDRDTTFDAAFSRAVEAFGLTAVRTAPRSPWQNPYVERVIGSIRRECPDHIIVFNERHLRRVLRTYVAYYQRSRTHLALGKDAPVERAVQPTGRIVVRPEVGGLHHRYERQAA